jgi:Flp pilus assembly protein CpaB
MEIASKSPLRGSLSSRTGSLVLAALAAIVAGVLVFMAIDDARNGSAAGGPSTVAVAKQLIPKGSSGESIAREQSFRLAEVEGNALVAGAVTDVAQVRDKVATQDIYPGQQLSTSDFAAGDGSLATQLANTERAVSLPIDSAHGMVGDVRAGDRVDVLVGFNEQSDSGRARPVMRALASNVEVLRAPGGGRGTAGAGQNVITVAVRDKVATQLAFTADNGKVWIVLRGGGSKDRASTDVVTMRDILFGVKPVSGQ